MRDVAMGLMLATSVPLATAAQTMPAPAPTPAPPPEPAAQLPAAATPPAAAPRTTGRRAVARPPADDANSDEPDVIVTGQRNLPGAVIGDIPPEVQLGPADIRSYGVSSVSDLLSELAPQIQSDRGSGGPPVVLLNGRRISGFQEVRDLPTEAIARVDILPEEVALKYGYPADQKVVNIVLRRRFRAVTTELADTTPTEGGRTAPDANVDVLNIKGPGRFNLHVDYNQAGNLTEADRNITEQPAQADPAPYRTLLPATKALTTNLIYATTLFGNKVSATFNGELETSDSTGLYGLPSVVAGTPATLNFGPLTQNSSSVTGHFGATFNGNFGHWRWSLTSSFDHVDSETFTDTGVDANGPLPGSRARSTSNTGVVDALFTGDLFDLPAGSVSTSIHVGGTVSDLSSDSFRNGVASETDITRDIVNGQLNVDVPISNRAQDVLGAIGTLSLNGNIAVNHLSDFGTLTTRGYGFNWQPRTGIRLLGSVTDQNDAPSAAQLGGPMIVTPNVRIFDYVMGTTATVTTVSGGNPNLVADSRHTAKLELSLKPWKNRDLTFVANYITTHTNNAIASFPTPTTPIEAAFPGRFTRDSGGNLIRLDTRPINFARTERSEIRYGFNFSHPLKSKLQKQLEAFRAGNGPNPFAGLPLPDFMRRRMQQGGGQPGGPPPGGDGAPPPPPGAGTPPPDGQGSTTGGNQPPGTPGTGGGERSGGGFGGGGGGFGGRGGGGGGGRGGGGGGGRLQFALYHTWYFTDRVLIAPGVPTLDLLDGGAIGQSGGQARHSLEGQAGYSNNGLGARLSVNYASGTRVDGGTPAAPTTLAFSGLATANLRLFFDATSRIDLIAKHPWLRGARVSLSVTNLFDSRQRVTDQTGETPISYQPDYLDPLGRSIKLSIRKLFF